MIPSLQEFSAAQREGCPLSPLEMWLSERGILDEVCSYLEQNRKPVATVYAYLTRHYNYNDLWQTEKPIRDLMNKVKRDNSAISA